MEEGKAKFPSPVFLCLEGAFPSHQQARRQDPATCAFPQNSTKIIFKQQFQHLGKDREKIHQCVSE